MTLTAPTVCVASLASQPHAGQSPPGLALLNQLETGDALRGKKFNGFPGKTKKGRVKSLLRGKLSRPRRQGQGGAGSPSSPGAAALGTATAGRMSDNPNMSPEQQQERWLEEGKAVVKQQAFLMCVPVPPALARAQSLRARARETRYVCLRWHALVYCHLCTRCVCTPAGAVDVSTTERLRDAGSERSTTATCEMVSSTAVICSAS